MSWQNRIVGHGEKPADQFQANPENWRTHPPAQRQALAAVLRQVGWVHTVIENVTTGHLVDGHERVWQALAEGDATPVPYTQVELTPDEERIILATLDPISAMANSDKDLIKQVLAQVVDLDTVRQDQDLAALLQGVQSKYGSGVTQDDYYTRKVESPLYTPQSHKPSITSLIDTSKTDELIQEINGIKGISKEERAFLIAAAHRFTVFNFAQIADYYAHSAPALQRLMEHSALVIIDFERAIELGFVQLTQRIAEMVGDEYES